MNDFTTTEIEQMTLNLRGFKSVEMISVMNKLGSELARREELNPKSKPVDKVMELLLA